VINPLEELPTDVGGSGLIGPGIGGGSVPVGEVPGIGGVGGTIAPLGSGINVAAVPQAGAVTGGLGGAGAPGIRAGAVVGTVLGKMVKSCVLI